MPEVEFRVDAGAGRGPMAPAVRAPGKGRKGGRAPEATPRAPLSGVVASYRLGLFAPGKSRIIIELAESARIVRAAVETDPEGGRRLVVEMARADRSSFLAEARKAQAQAAAPAPVAPAASAPAVAGTPVIVIDAGHGGVDDGAHAASGAMEKDIVLEFARKLSERLEKTGRYRTVLTRSTDVFIPLGDRVKIAREAGAALFVSIHADMLVDEPQVAGATIYTVSDKASDAQAARFADKENQSDAIAGLDGAEGHDDVADILFDLTRRETRSYSHVFARTLVDYFGEVAKLNKNARRSAGFRVLKAPDVPSVLLELGYLSSEADSRNLVAGEWRERVSGAVAGAIDAFFKSRGDGSGKQEDIALGLKASFDAAARLGEREGPR
jgi:N-acetylmuramoyl-L-alanine amidase